MLLKQQFKTYDGARKRAAFENAHPTTRRSNRYCRYAVVRCDGITGERAHSMTPTTAPIVWRLEKTQYSACAFK